MQCKIQNAKFKHDVARDKTLQIVAPFTPLSQTMSCLHFEF